MLKYLKIVILYQMKGYFCYMKFILHLLIVVFLINQGLPTISALIDDEVTFTVADYNNDNESDDFKDFQFNVNRYTSAVLFYDFEQIKLKILSANNLIADSLPSKIFLSPPELI